MDFSKLAQLLGRDKTKDPTFNEYVQENAQETLKDLKDKPMNMWEQGGVNIQNQMDAQNRFLSDVKEKGAYNPQDAFDMAGDPQQYYAQLGVAGVGGSLGRAATNAATAEANAVRTGGPSSERFVVGAGKPVQISSGANSAYGKYSAGNTRLRQLMEEQARARAKANAPLNAVDKSKIIIK